MNNDAFGAEEPAQRAMQKGPKKFFKLTFIVYGDRDEIEPILGVASGLKKAGHDVLFITHHSMKGLVELWGLRFGPGNPYDPQQQYATEYSSMIMAGQSGDLCLSKIIHLNNNFKLIEEATLTCIKRMTDIIVCNVMSFLASCFRRNYLVKDAYFRAAGSRWRRLSGLQSHDG